LTSIKYDFNFLAGFYENEEINFNKYNLKLQLYVNTESNYDQQIAFNRMDFVIHDFMTNAVFVEETDIDTIAKLLKADIKVVTVDEPGPIDQILGITLVEKLRLIVEDVLVIFESELESVVGGGVKYIYYPPEEKLPKDQQIISTSAEKWWNSPNPRFTNKLEIDFKQLTWKDFSLEWEEEVEEEPEVKTTTKKDSNIVTMKFTDDS